MHVGMNRKRPAITYAEAGVPHARGDEPPTMTEATTGKTRSPCTWG